MSEKGQCGCGSSQFTVRGKPLMRLFCHCESCQAFNQAPFSDVAVFKAADIELPSDAPVEFSAYQSPALVQRGKCKQCGQPAIELVEMPLMPKLVIVPCGMLKDSALPDAGFHLFYHRRVADIADKLPKYSSFLSSQLSFMLRLFARLIAK